jgi:hypothetical protein
MIFRAMVTKTRENLTVTQTRENFDCVLAWEGPRENGFPLARKIIFQLPTHHVR